MSTSREEHGFTLIELLVCITVSAILIGIGVAAYERSAKSAQAVACLSNMRQIGSALSLYLADHNMQFPELKAAREKITDDDPAIDNFLNEYGALPAIFRCPADRGGIAERTGTSYFWNSTLNGQSVASANFLNLTSDPSHIPVLFDKEGFHPYLKDKVNILYMDGHATQDLKFWSESK